MRRLLIGIAGLLLVAAACTGDGGDEGATEGGGGAEPVTITVMDYYGKATPIEPAIAGFEQENPGITVKYEAIDWDTLHEKFTVQVSAGNAPDVATMDMTWVPTFAANGLFADLSQLSGGQANGQPLTNHYSEGALEAMTFDDAYVTMMFDFDAYALYYRADQFRKKGIEVPTTWDELQAAAEQLAEDTDGDGENDKYLYALSAGDCFHWCQLLFQNGGSILSEGESSAAFNEASGAGAMAFYQELQDSGNAIYWTDAEGVDLIPGIKDERIGMFSDGPYYMGLLKESVPEQEGKWKVATSPYAEEPGSYLGGTGLSIPSNAEHPEEAWRFIQYMMRPEQQVEVFTQAGAAPATQEALAAPELTEPDPYFDGQVPFPVFQESMATATHFPYVAQWDQIDTIISDMVDEVMLGKSPAQEALDKAAASTNDELAG